LSSILDFIYLFIYLLQAEKGPP